MSHICYSQYKFQVIEEGYYDKKKKRNGYNYILYNTKKEWKDGHTHLHSKKNCIDTIRFIHQERIPTTNNKRYIESLIRVTEPGEYQNKLIKKLKEISRSK